ncbi:DDE superfamily endonuclease-domain-containing protein [Mycena vulgaris]|nr:DDE superfamily endonuclease-domain-containing protein [Mycena vulgaris]
MARQAAKRAGLKLKKKESKVQEAVTGIGSGLYKNARDAAEALKIPEQQATIHRRLKGTVQTRIDAQARFQRLTPEQEVVLAAWTKFYGFAGIPLSRRTISAKVYSLCGKSPGSHWLDHFLRRHPDCCIGRPSGLDPKRAKAFNPTNVKAHFDLLKTEFANNGRPIPACNIYNMDEFLFSSADMARYKLKSDELELTTIYECVCLDGSSTVPPGFVFAGSLMCPAWFDVGDDIVICTTDTGWTTDAAFLLWFQKGFTPAALAHSDPDFPIFLLDDGRKSHDQIDVIDFAIEKDIRIGMMGSHQTHRLQPCDVGAFGPSKTHWRARCDEVLHTTGETILVADIVKEWMGVREKSFKVETIKQAWFKSGINLDASGLFPRLMPGIFAAADFAPSISTSTQLHLPLGFPVAPSDSANSGASSSEEPSSPDTSAASSSVTPPSPPTSSSPVDVMEPPPELSGPALVEYFKTLALKLASERDAAKSQAVAAEAHAVLAGSHIQSLQTRLNAKSTKRGGNDRTLSTTARMLTSAEGKALAEEKRTTQLEKKAKDDENRTNRLLADTEVIQRRVELGREGMEFEGKIKTLKAPQLKDLAWSLNLDEVGTREVLIARIREHFGQKEELKQDKRYAGLWRAGRRRRAAVPAVPIDDSDQDAPMDDVLTTMPENVASGSGSSTYVPPPPLPRALYTFSDSWTPPQPDYYYHYPIDHPPPFSPEFYAPQQFQPWYPDTPRLRF